METLCLLATPTGPALMSLWSWSGVQKRSSITPMAWVVVTELTDSSGTVVQAYVYDSYGQVQAQFGDISNPYTYTARELDTETGLYYYRARYYDPAVGRFLAEDSLRGNLVFPQSQNRYSYVQSNPIIFTDPAGNVTNLVAGVISASVSIAVDLTLGERDFGTIAVNAGAAFGAGFLTNGLNLAGPLVKIIASPLIDAFTNEVFKSSLLPCVDFSFERVGQDALIGLIGGGIFEAAKLNALSRTPGTGLEIENAAELINTFGFEPAFDFVSGVVGGASTSQK